jgi:hypothetical protein
VGQRMLRSWAGVCIIMHSDAQYIGSKFVGQLKLRVRGPVYA